MSIDNHLKADGTTAGPADGSRQRLLFVGGVLWVLCLLGIVFCWYQWYQRVQRDKAVSSVNRSDEEDGRSGKQFKLVPQKDGSFVAEEVTKENEDNPWDADGIDDFSFTDTDGNKVTKNDLIGKPFVISFVFTFCRGPCPNVTMQMRELQERLKDYDFRLVTLTVDPERDTIETLKQYGKAQGANFEKWKFLTGDQAEIYGLIQRSFKMPVKEVTGADRLPGFEIIHSTNIMLVDANGRVIGKYNAQKDEEMSQLRNKLKHICKHE